MSNPIQFAYTLPEKATGTTGLLPFVPLTLHFNQQSVGTTGLLDTGYTVSVLPYSIGLAA